MVAPLSAGAVQDTSKLPLSTVSVGAAGASGSCVAGVALPEADQALSPTLLVAWTCTW